MSRKKVDQYGSNNPCWRGGKPHCLDCDKKLKGYKSKRCKSCSNRKNRLGKTGELSPHWKGGTYNPSQRTKKAIREKFRYEMQELVFERDNYSCQKCNSKENLQVDHIQPWAEYIELRFNMDNCRTLCMKCHYFITYGRIMPENINWGHNSKKEVNKIDLL